MPPGRHPVEGVGQEVRPGPAVVGPDLGDPGASVHGLEAVLPGGDGTRQQRSPGTDGVDTEGEPFTRVGRGHRAPGRPAHGSALVPALEDHPDVRAPALPEHLRASVLRTPASHRRRVTQPVVDESGFGENHDAVGHGHGAGHEALPFRGRLR